MDVTHSPTSLLFQYNIDLKYALRKRSSAVKWLLINLILFLVFTYDLWCRCPGYSSSLHYVEGACAVMALAAAFVHAQALVLPKPPAQLKARHQSGRAERSEANAMRESGFSADDTMALSRSWERESPPNTPIATTEQRSLTHYLEQSGEESRAWGVGISRVGTYRRAVNETSPEPTLSMAATTLAEWQRLDIEPNNLAQFNLNLRMWISATIVRRLDAEVQNADKELSRRGLGAGAVERAPLQALLKAAADVSSVRTLLQYLQPTERRAEAVRRVRSWAKGACLATYRWDHGEPSDAELLLRLLLAYLDGQTAACGGACLAPCSHCSAFSDGHAALEPGAKPPPCRPAVVCLSKKPPHFVILLSDGRALDVGPGRNNLLHSLLLLIALWSSQRERQGAAPSLTRLNFGLAGLNLLWVIGR